jgi:hypothetical protein
MGAPALPSLGKDAFASVVVMVETKAKEQTVSKDERSRIFFIMVCGIIVSNFVQDNE